jgi:type II secretory pathway component PulK
LEQALTLVGVEAGEIPRISSAILDWIDSDELPHVNGAESDEYQAYEPPYYAKNRPIDDLSELLLVRGITQDMYWGASSAKHAPAAFQKLDRFGRILEEPVYQVGLAEVFTPFSSGRINVNTASSTTLQVIPTVDENIAAQIIKMRSGPDGMDGTEDDTPFINVGEALMNAGVNQQMIPQISRYCDVRSRTFEVQVTVRGSHRTFFAVVGRNSARDLQMLSFYWKDK